MTQFFQFRNGSVLSDVTSGVNLTENHRFEVPHFAELTSGELAAGCGVPSRWAARLRTLQQVWAQAGAKPDRSF
jgi:hypothetical protein